MIATERILTDEMIDEITALFPRYPTKQAVTLPALHIVNERLRCVPHRAVIEIAELLELAPAEVQDTLSFYGIFKQDKPHGRVRAWVCRSISCALRGGEEVLAHLCHAAGLRPGETTPDGALTIEFAECLGACEFAPCMLAGELLLKDLSMEQAGNTVKSLEQLAYFFVYGSLMDDRLANHNWVLREKAILRHYRRDFNKKSTQNWGTKALPAPTLGLEFDTNSTCIGVVLGFPRDEGAEVEKYLQKREGDSFNPRTNLSVKLMSGEDVRATIFVNDPQRDPYIGNKSLLDRVQMGKDSAKGKAGNGVDYVKKVKKALDHWRINDAIVNDFYKKVCENDV